MQSRNAVAKTTKTAYGYARVSTEEQAESGESLLVQRERIEAIAKAEGLSLAGVFIEPGISARVPFASRPEGSRALQTAKQGDTLIALKLDRCFRDTSDALQTVAALNRAGIRLYIADMRGYIAGDAAGELHLSMLASFATFERRRCQERIVEAKQSLKARGRYAGGATPFGYRRVPSTSGEKTRHGELAHYLEPVAEIRDLARDLLAKGYSSRLARYEFASRGYRVSHDAIAGLFRKLQAEQATA
jgi:DNA invertase Pin-like site-specific DNA recombinase